MVVVGDGNMDVRRDNGEVGAFALESLRRRGDWAGGCEAIEAVV